MKYHVAILLAVLSFGLSAQAAVSGSSSISCSGHLRGEFFFAFAFQYLFSNDGYEITQEQHQFQFQGLLGDEEFSLEGFDGDHVIYRSRNFRLAVPYNNSQSLFVKDLRRKRVDSPSSSGGGRKWEVLCSR